MRRPVVLLDCDGVLADFVGGYLDLVHVHTGRLYNRTDVTRWDIAGSLGLSKGEKSAVNQAIKKQGFCASLRHYPGALEGVALLRSVAEVHVVTSPWTGPHWAGERIEWLREREQFDFAVGDITQTSRKWAVSGDVMIDDKASHVSDWIVRARARVAGLLWDTPHNRTEEDPPFVERVTSWGRVVEIVGGWR